MWLRHLDLVPDARLRSDGSLQAAVVAYVSAEVEATMSFTPAAVPEPEPTAQEPTDAQTSPP